MVVEMTLVTIMGTGDEDGDWRWRYPQVMIVWALVNHRRYMFGRASLLIVLILKIQNLICGSSSPFSS
jgi:hypothetical protein